MSINFSVGEFIIVKQDYVSKTLSNITPQTRSLLRTISSLSTLGNSPNEVLATGIVNIMEQGIEVTKSFIKLLPANPQSPSYQNGAGIIIYFDSDTYLNNSFKFSTAFLCVLCSVRVLNNSGVTITINNAVRYTGFNASSQLPTVSLASAASSTTSIVFGVSDETILNGETGTVLIQGAFSGVNTNGYSINGLVYLSDTPGAFQSSPGTVQSIIGRVQIVATQGTISIQGISPFSSPEPAPASSWAATLTINPESGTNNPIILNGQSLKFLGSSDYIKFITEVFNPGFGDEDILVLDNDTGNQAKLLRLSGLILRDGVDGGPFTGDILLNQAIVTLTERRLVPKNPALSDVKDQFASMLMNNLYLASRGAVWFNEDVAAKVIEFTLGPTIPVSDGVRLMIDLTAVDTSGSGGTPCPPPMLRGLYYVIRNTVDIDPAGDMMLYRETVSTPDLIGARGRLVPIDNPDEFLADPQVGGGLFNRVFILLRSAAWISWDIDLRAQQIDLGGLNVAPLLNIGIADTSGVPNNDIGYSLIRTIGILIRSGTIGFSGSDDIIIVRELYPSSTKGRISAYDNPVDYLSDPGARRTGFYGSDFSADSAYVLGPNPTTDPKILWGAGSPENTITAPPGSLYTNTSGGAGTTLYVKESGTGNTGWVAK